MNHFVHAMYREGERECMVAYSQEGGGRGEREGFYAYVFNEWSVAKKDL